MTSPCPSPFSFPYRPMSRSPVFVRGGLPTHPPIPTIDSPKRRPPTQNTPRASADWGSAYHPSKWFREVGFFRAPVRQGFIRWFFSHIIVIHHHPYFPNPHMNKHKAALRVKMPYLWLCVRGFTGMMLLVIWTFALILLFPLNICWSINLQHVPDPAKVFVGFGWIWAWPVDAIV